MPTKSYLSFAGFFLLLVATYCPLLRPFGIFPNMNVYDLNQPFGITLMLTAVIGVLGIVLRQRAIIKLCAWISLLLVVLLFVASYFKVHHLFSFIPFKSFAGYLTSKIKFKWGWYPMFAGPILAVIGVATTKSGKTIRDNKLK